MRERETEFNLISTVLKYGHIAAVATEVAFCNKYITPSIMQNYVYKPKEIVIYMIYYKEKLLYL